MSVLAQPFDLPCGARLTNRIAKSAMSENLGDKDHLPDERLCRVYARWATSGAGLLITGNVMVDETALGEPHNVVVVPGRGHLALAHWAESAQSGGAACWPQINHPGRQSPRTLSSRPVAPSAVALQLPGKLFAEPRALESNEIVDLVGRFGRAAGACKAAGFQGVQIHGAHGYLVSQFLSPLTNLRDDAWGGDAPRRRRFLLEVLRAMRDEVGADFPVGVKLNSADFQRGGFSEEESMEVVAALEAEGLDLLEISGGTYERPAMAGRGAEVRASTVAREAYFLDYARRVRGHTRLPLMLTGGFRTRLGMEAAVESGAIDVVGIARPMALEPDFPARVLRGEADDSKVEPRRTGVGVLDGLLEVAWYSYQINRMGRGLDPDPGVWPWTVLAKLGWESVVG